LNSKERRKIREIIKCLKECGCDFWACDGPDKPYDAKTCKICTSIKELRTLIDGKVRIP